MSMTAAPAAPLLPWEAAVSTMDWRQGEHVTLIGPTGAGKTELTTRILEDRNWCVFFGTKRHDETQDRLRKMGYRTITNGFDLNSQVASRYILRPKWPTKKFSTKALKAAHADVFRDGLVAAFLQTNWTVILDEARYICGNLGLAEEVQMFWLQGRSQGNSVVANTQRPRYIPLEAYDQATHLFFWKDTDLNNVTRVAELAGLNRDLVLQVVPNLPRHDVLYVNTVTGELFITNTRR